MLRSTQKKLAAVVVGVVLAGAPLAAFDIWLNRVIDRQSEDDVYSGVNRATAIIESRLTNVVASLDALAAQGADSCRQADLEKLRRASFSTSPAKEFSVLGPDGQTLCTDLGLSLGTRTVVGTLRTASLGEVMIEVIRLGERDANFLRVRRIGSGGNSLAALMPPDMFIPMTASRGGSFGANVRVFTRDGLLIGEGGKPLPPGVKPDDVWSATMRSDRFGIAVTVRTLKEAAAPNDLHTIGWIVTTAGGLAILALAWLFGRRFGNDPVAAVRRALDAHEFVPYYQPIVDITTGKVLGAEVLARWRKPNGTVIPPAAFIPLVEQGGLIVELTECLMRRVCVEAGAAYARRPDLKVGFNLTARHFADEAVVADVRAIFGNSPIRLTQVTLELTEREPIDNLTTTRRVIAALQGLGCRIALDDVGTGHSGLSSILKLGVDIIKIDKMFVDSLGSDRNSATIVTTLVELARNMQMEVVAEGVESFEQVADLRARGIRAAQGYVFAPPLPGSSFLTLLDSLDPVAGQPAAQLRGHRAA